MKSCATCEYFHAHPQQAVGALVEGACYGVPPQTMLVPIAPPEQTGKILKPNQPQQQAAGFATIRVTVHDADFACSVYRERVA